MKKKFLDVLKKYNCDLTFYEYCRAAPDHCAYEIKFVPPNGEEEELESYYDIHHQIDSNIHSYEINGKNVCTTSKEGIVIDFERFVISNCA